MNLLCVFLLRGRNTSVTAGCLQEMGQGEAAAEEEEEVLPAAQQLTFDLGSLRACFKRRRQDAVAMHVDTPGSKKGRFEAASLQVSNPVLFINIITGVYQLLNENRKWDTYMYVGIVFGVCLPNCGQLTSASA